MNIYNPYQQFANQYNTSPMLNFNPPAPTMEIPKVNGEESARAFSIGPNSSVILLDINNPLIWVVTTDASGFKNVQPYTITPYTPEQPLNPGDVKTQLNDLSDRLTKLEERMNNRGQSYHGNAWKNNKQPNQPVDSNGENGT